jgi:hypothetical protein
MSFASVRRLLHRPRSLAWLLALALWLPVAQWSAATHALLHLPSAAADDGERPAHLPGSCKACVVAATIGGAAPQSPSVFAILPRLPRAHPPAPGEAGSFQHRAAPYRSRAPPSLHA